MLKKGDKGEREGEKKGLERTQSRSPRSPPPPPSVDCLLFNFRKASKILHLVSRRVVPPERDVVELALGVRHEQPLQGGPSGNERGRGPVGGRERDGARVIGGGRRRSRRLRCRGFVQLGLLLLFFVFFWLMMATMARRRDRDREKEGERERERERGREKRA